MIQPIFTANQAINAKAKLASSPSFGSAKKMDNSSNVSYLAASNAYLKDNSVKGEKLDINCEGCREYSLNGKKINYFA